VSERTILSWLLTAIACLVATSAHAGPLGYGDPTQPTPLDRPAANAPSGDGAAPRSDSARWHLSSTLVAGNRRVAVINGRSVALGARIDGARLLAVDAGGALIEHEGRRIQLQLPPPAGKTITAKTPSGR
jgi:MSHA biogenesis protein MshK